jgi:hypothetical protein
MNVSDQPHVPAALFPEKEVFYPLDRELGVPQKGSGRFEEGEKKIFPLSGFELMIFQPVS